MTARVDGPPSLDLHSGETVKTVKTVKTVSRVDTLDSLVSVPPRARGKSVKSGGGGPVPEPGPSVAKSGRGAPVEDYPRFIATMAAAFDRLTAGRKTYGAFSPATDRRDLHQEAEAELLDAIAYAYLAILKLSTRTPKETPCERRREGYHVVLVPLPALPGDPPPEVRLRRGLKALLRTHRLRCVSVEAVAARPEVQFGEEAGRESEA